jgi:hypothetical protein
MQISRKKSNIFEQLQGGEEMKKIVIALLSLVLVLSSIGCSNSGKADDPVSNGIESSADDEQVKKTEKDKSPGEKVNQPLQSIAGSHLPLYPDAELIHSDDRKLVYATDDRAKDVLKFYEENAEITTLMTSVGYYLLGTDLYDVTMQDFKDTTERRAIIDQYFEDAGGKAVREFMILEGELAKLETESLLGEKLDITLIVFQFIDYYM